MILHSITGTLTEKQLNGFACCDVNNVEWLLAMSEQSMSLLPPIGSQVRIYTQLKVSENSIALYGFVTREERSLFEALISVSGIGPKVALSMLSKASTAEISACIIQGNANSLAKLPGIGNKTAQKMILQLGDKLEKLLLLNAPKALAAVKAESGLQQLLEQRHEYSELHTALIAMGYDGKRCSEVLDDLFREWQNSENVQESKENKESQENQSTSASPLSSALPPEGERLRQAILRLSS